MAKELPPRYTSRHPQELVDKFVAMNQLVKRDSMERAADRGYGRTAGYINKQDKFLSPVLVDEKIDKILERMSMEEYLAKKEPPKRVVETPYVKTIQEMQELIEEHVKEVIESNTVRLSRPKPSDKYVPYRLKVKRPERILRCPPPRS